MRKIIASDQPSDPEAVKDNRSQAGKMSPNVNIASADLSLNIPTSLSVNIYPSSKVFSLNSAANL